MSRSRGFTLIELIFTMAILAIIVATAAPSFNGVMRTVEIDSGVSKIRSVLSYARTQAIDVQDNVVACASNDAATCTGESDWSVGVIVFNDADNDQQLNNADVLYRVWEEGAAEGAVLEVTEEDLASGVWASASSITFNDEAGIDDTLNSVVFELKVQNCGVGDLRTVTVNAAGRIQVTTGDC